MHPLILKLENVDFHDLYLLMEGDNSQSDPTSKIGLCGWKCPQEAHIRRAMTMHLPMAIQNVGRSFACGIRD